MGTWGVSIFSDDLAADVRDDWRARVRDGVSDADATAQLVAAHRPRPHDDASEVFWIALAAAQHETGRLVPEVRDAALQAIGSGRDLARWRADQPSLARRREQVLQRLATKLAGPQPKPRRVRGRQLRSTLLTVGTAIHLRSHENDAEAIAVVVDESDDGHGGTAPVVELLLWAGGVRPSADEMSQVPPIHSTGRRGAGA
jgi:hypothetical protein